jgi:hypothetical protein
MRSTTITGMASFSLVLLTHCAVPAEKQEEQYGAAESALEVSNALSPNALSPNALSPNALSPNALSPNALSPNALDPKALASLQDPGAGGDLSRMLLKYTVSCALDSSQSFSFSWKDSARVVHNESYPGQLGIAPEWASGPLDVQGQELVSGCLCARTNWYGVQVIISLRYVDGVLRIVIDTPEHLFYPHVEGACWGNLFSATPYVSACNVPENAQHSRSAKRDCENGHINAQGQIEECGMIHIVGSCQDRCSAPILSGALGLLGQYYPSCDDPAHGTNTNVITTALP